MASRKHVVGAMRIMSRWPEHWLRSAGYWWVGLALLCLFILAIYNNATAISVMSHSSSISFKNNKKLNDTIIYMYILENGDFLNVNKYLPHIEELIGELPGLQCTLYVIVNDLNGLKIMKHVNVHRNLDSPQLNIEYIKLTQYIKFSPFEEIWQKIPSEFLPFFVKALHIWNNDGIVLDPTILLPGPHKQKYRSKILSIIIEYETSIIIATKDASIYLECSTKRNNIQDIINDMQYYVNYTDNNKEVDLLGEESKVIKTYAENIDDKFKEKIEFKAQNNNLTTTKFKKINDILNLQKVVLTKSNYTNVGSSKNNTAKAIQPLFVSEIPTFVTIAANDTYDHSNESVYLTMDLYGYILATNKACHSFIGMLFEDLHKLKNVALIRDYISSELNAFCKDKKRTFSCKGL